MCMHLLLSPELQDFISVPERERESCSRTSAYSVVAMASWKKTITTPFRKACTFFNQQPPRKSHHHHQEEQEEDIVMDLRGEVMACGYEDVQVMWSMLDKARARPCALTS